MKKILIIICIFMLSAAGCGQSGNQMSHDAACTISDFTTEISEPVQLAPDARFISFAVTSGTSRYKVGYAVISDGVRKDNIVYTQDPASIKIGFSFLMAGDFYNNNVMMNYGMYVDTWESPFMEEFPLELPALMGMGAAVRPEAFNQTLSKGEEIVLAVFAGSLFESSVRAIDLGKFDQYKTIDEAMSSPEILDNPFNLIFYVSAL